MAGSQNRRLAGLLAAALIVVCATAYGGQNAVAIRFPGSPGKNTQIGAFVRQGTVYASLNDLAGVLELKTASNAALKQFELRSAGYTLTVGANNPFVNVTDRDTNTSMRQLPYRVLYGANSFFVPIASFLPVIASIVKDELTLDETASTITVGKAAAPAYPFDIAGITVQQKENGIAVRLSAQKPLRNYESWLKTEDGRTSLYITVDNAKADTAALISHRPNSLVQDVMVFPYPSSVQIVIVLKAAGVSVEPVPVPGSNDIIFAVRTPMPEPLSPTQARPAAGGDTTDISDDDPDTTTTPGIVQDVHTNRTEQPSSGSAPSTKPAGTSVPAARPARKGRDVSETLDRQRDRWKLDCIVIDAGHGGFDPGTIGVTRTKEKDVTLGVALKLGRLIEKNLRDVRVVYTRKTDEFIELYKRGQIANAAGGKLFISIHCNAAPRKPSPANGFEIYLLRPGKTENAIRIATRENEVVKLEKDYENRYQTLDENRFILLTMAQSAYVKYSERFAEIASEQMKNGTPLDPNGVKQAGFYVLVGASMPNVLVETAYLSNRSDERFLKSGSGQEQIAQALLSAIKIYKKEYEMALGEGAGN